MGRKPLKQTSATVQTTGGVQLAGCDLNRISVSEHGNPLKRNITKHLQKISVFAVNPN